GAGTYTRHKRVAQGWDREARGPGASQDGGIGRVGIEEGKAVGLVRIVVNAAAGAEYGFVRYAVSEAHTRRPILMLREGEVESRRIADERRLFRIQLGGDAIDRICDRGQLVANAVVERQLARDLPFVEYEEAVAPFRHSAAHFRSGRIERLGRPEDEIR